MADVRKIKLLGKLLLKLETTGKSGSNRKLLLINISYLLPGIFLPWLLIKQNTDPTGFEFAFITYLFYSMIISFTVITELDNIIISKTEADLLTAMPVDDSLIVRAKMFVILRYSAFLMLPLLLPGGIYFYSVVKSIPRAVLYITAGFMVCFLFINIIVLLYSIALKVFRSSKISSYTLSFQLVLILAMIIGYQFISLGVTSKAGSITGSYISSMKSKGIIDYFPQAWYALLPARNNYMPDFALMLKLMLPVFICFMGYYALKLYLDENYAFIREKFLSSRGAGYESAHGKRRFIVFKMISDFIRNVYLRNHTERSSFGLISALYRSDKTVKLAIIPMIIIPAGLAVFALLSNQLPSPFDKNYYESKPVMHISILLCVLVVLNTAIIGVRVTNFPGVSWVYSSYPVDSLKNFKNGFRKFFVVYLLIPVSVVTGIIYLVKIPAHHALIHILFIFTAANLYNSIYSFFSKTLPFTKENTMINSLQRMTSILFPFLFGIIIILIQLISYKTMLTAIIAVLAMVTVTFWINYFGFVRKK